MSNAAAAADTEDSIISIDSTSLPPLSIPLVSHSVSPSAYSSLYRPLALSSQPLSSACPILLDSGSYNWRIGFACHSTPQLAFRSQVGKYRTRRDSQASVIEDAAILRIGRDLQFEDFSSPNVHMKSPFSAAEPFGPANLLTSPDVFDSLLDYSFLQLGFSSSSSVDHPLMLTEPLANPSYCRARLSELLFELFNVPAVNFSVDALNSAFDQGIISNSHSNSNSQSGLIFSIGHSCSNIIPVLSGRALLSNSFRSSIGVGNLVDYFSQQLDLHYPTYKAALPGLRVEQFYRDYCEIASDYNSQLMNMGIWMKTRELNSLPQPRPIHIRFPIAAASTAVNSSLESENDRNARRSANAARLKLMAQQRQEIRNRAMKLELEELLKLKKLFDSNRITDKELIKKSNAIEDITNEFESAGQIFKRISHLKSKFSPGEEIAVVPAEPEFPLLSRPDEELTPAELKQKRHQRLLKSGIDARKRKRDEQLTLAKEREIVEAAEEEERMKNPLEYELKLIKRREQILSQRANRLAMKKGQGDGNRKSAAATIRMRIVASMADESNIDGEDEFGMSDDDWEVYRKIQLEQNEEENELEREELDRIKLKLEFNRVELESRGIKSTDNEYLELLNNQNNINNNINGNSNGINHHDNSIELLIDRIRTPELLFQPSIAGRDEAGLIELARKLLARLDDSTAQKCSQNIFITGGGSRITGLKERIELEFRKIRPIGSQFNVRLDENPLNSSWCGMKKLWHNQSINTSSISESNQSNSSNNSFWTLKSDYHEFGSEYFKENSNSNWKFKSTLSQSQSTDGITTEVRKRKR